MQTIRARKADVAPLVRATFHDYTGRKFTVRITEQVRLDDLNWSGGTRSQYRATTLDGTPLGNTDRYAAMWPGSNLAEGQTLPLVPGAAVVRHTIFCGTDCGLTIHIHPADAPRWLPKE